MRYKTQKEFIDGRRFWTVIDTKTGQQVSSHKKKHSATIDSATRNASVEKPS